MCSPHKLPIPNIFQGTVFKKHYGMSIDQRQQFGNDFSQLFLILTTTTDRKEKIIQFINNVQLHPIDIDYNEFVTKNSSEKKRF